MIQSSTFMGLKMLGGPPVKSPWYIEVGGFFIVFGMLIWMLISYSYPLKHARSRMSRPLHSPTENKG